ncbi:MAG: hypothetical protein M3O22_02675 [Pseudomonadota bacterium]|nr:hypothetical protein [Pseudomonadota bacterium]
MKPLHVPRFLVTFVVVALFTVGYEMLVHGHLLMPLYLEAATLWRPMEEMEKGMLLNLARQLAMALAFVALYARCCAGLPLYRTLKFGFWTGLMLGVSAAGCYVWMPIPGKLALAWLAALLVWGLASALIARLVYRAPSTVV